MNRSPEPSPSTPMEMVRSEEELAVGVERVEAGRIRARKVLERHDASTIVDRLVEHAEIERRPADPDDSGLVETLSDGSLSIPLLEEELVVRKRLVVRERVVIRKRSETARDEVGADLRWERLEVSVDPSIAGRVNTA